ncbi:hypothetical protein NEAUS06_2526, partial [Nematocida ausubeli]
QGRSAGQSGNFKEKRGSEFFLFIPLCAPRGRKGARRAQRHTGSHPPTQPLHTHHPLTTRSAVLTPLVQGVCGVRACVYSCGRAWHRVYGTGRVCAPSCAVYCVCRGRAFLYRGEKAGRAEKSLRAKREGLKRRKGGKVRGREGRQQRRQEARSEQGSGVQWSGESRESE